MSSPKLPIKLVIFDFDDTLIFGEHDESVGPHPMKFQPMGHSTSENLGPDRVTDNPFRVQVLVPNARQVLQHLVELGLTLTFASMGPYWQMRRFADAFQISQYFDWELGSYDRRDKGEKVELIMEHYDGRLITTVPAGDDSIANQLLKREEVVFVDDNLGYLGRVDNYLRGVKVIWAHYQTGSGLFELYQDLEEQYGIDLTPRQK